MAIRARLAAPPPPAPEPHPAIAPKWAAVPAHLLFKGDRRFEAGSYLSGGFGMRVAIEERAVGWKRFGQYANISQPARVKATLVSREFGTPFLIANQMFSLRPHVRKWLAIEQLANAESLFVPQGTILVRRSADVGRSVLTCAHHEGHLISDHFFRIEPIEADQIGWLYAYIRSQQARAMMTGSQYGHIINHIESSHLKALPVPVVREEIAADFQKRTQAILALRNRAHRLALEAEERFEKALGRLKVKDWGEAGFDIRASSLFKTRRRLEATPHNPGVATIRRHLAKNGSGFVALAEAGFDVWLPGRFKRIPAADGIELVDSSAVFETNPDHDKRIADGDFGDPHNGRVKAGWLLMARSGQTYGINGNVAFATVAHEGLAVSDDLLRIAPKPDAAFRAGYLFVALSHPLLGRPLVKSLAYGSSIPHIDAADLLDFSVVRLPAHEENAIADLAEESATEQARADVLEREMAADAGKLIEKFLAGDMLSFVTTMTTTTPTSKPRFGALPEHSRVRLVRANAEHGLKAGAEGAIVHVYGGGKGYEVEFLVGKRPPAVVTLKRSDIEPIKNE